MELEFINSRLREEIPSTLVVRRPVPDDIARLLGLANRDREVFPENYIVVPPRWTRASLTRRLELDDEKAVAVDASGRIVCLMAFITGGQSVVGDWFLVDDALSPRERLRAVRSAALTLLLRLEASGHTSFVGEANRLAGIVRFPELQGYWTPAGTDPVTGAVRTYRFEIPLAVMAERTRTNHAVGLAPGDADWRDT